MKKEVLKSEIVKLNIIWGLFLIGLVVFFLIFFLTVPEIKSDSNENDSVSLLYISYMMVILLIPSGYFLYNNSCKKGTSESSYYQKFITYRTSTIMKFMMFGIAGFSLTIVYILTKNVQILYMFSIVLIILLISKPSVSQFKKDLKITEENNNSSVEPNDK